MIDDSIPQVFVFRHSGRGLSRQFVQSVTLCISRMLLDSHGVLELLLALTVVCGIHSSIMVINFCYHEMREESTSSVKTESQLTESISSQALTKLAFKICLVVSRCRLRVPNFQFYLNGGMIRVAERRNVVALMINCDTCIGKNGKESHCYYGRCA